VPASTTTTSQGERHKRKRPHDGEDVDASTYEIFTDGGCIGNRDVARNRDQPAGWGVVVRLAGATVAELYGPVETNPSGPGFLGAETKSNNTGELSAMGHAFAWLSRRGDRGRGAVIKYDSEYAAKIVQNIFRAHKNQALAATCKARLADARRDRTVRFAHVKGHSGCEGNERADALVKLGCRGLQSVEDAAASSTTSSSRTTTGGNAASKKAKTASAAAREVVDLTGDE